MNKYQLLAILECVASKQLMDEVKAVEEMHRDAEGMIREARSIKEVAKGRAGVLISVLRERKECGQVADKYAEVS